MTDTFTQSERSRVMRAVKSKDTTPELIVRRLVHSLGFRYRLHDPSLPGKPDLVLRRLHKLIIVNGCFWHLHGCARCRIPASRRSYWLKKLNGNVARDRRVLRQLRRVGWRVLVVWECQTRPDRLDALRSRILQFLTRTE